MCLVLLSGHCRVRWGGAGWQALGPRRSVFESYPHALYLPAGVSVRGRGAGGFRDRGRPRAGHRGISRRDSFVPRTAATRFAAAAMPRARSSTSCRRRFRPSACSSARCSRRAATGRAIRLTSTTSTIRPSKSIWRRRITSGFAADGGYAFQRLYTADERFDETFRVEDGDLLLIPEGYHPFVTAFGYDAYYLNVLAGTRRSMAASDDPRYARMRQSWPPPDPAAAARAQAGAPAGLA